MGKHLEQALPSVYTLQCLTGEVDPPQKHLRCKKGAPKKLQVPGTQCKKTKRKNSLAEVKSNW